MRDGIPVVTSPSEFMETVDELGRGSAVVYLPSPADDDADDSPPYRAVRCKCGGNTFHLALWQSPRVTVCSDCGRITSAGSLVDPDACRQLRGEFLAELLDE